MLVQKDFTLHSFQYYFELYRTVPWKGLMESYVVHFTIIVVQVCPGG